LGVLLIVVGLVRVALERLDGNDTDDGNDPEWDGQDRSAAVDVTEARS